MFVAAPARLPHRTPRTVRLLTAAALAVSPLVCAGAASAAPGDAVPSFGTGGVVRTDIGLFDTPSDLAVQPDGRLVAVGTVDRDGTRNVFVARYLADGSADPSFANGGPVVPERYHQVGPRLALQPDGGIVLATRGESAGGPLFLYRFHADGTPDLGFGTAGTASVAPPAGLGIQNVAGVGVLADGRLVVGLRASVVGGSESVAIARLQANGAPDASFGSGGFVHVSRGRLMLPLAFDLLSDGRMLVAGYAWMSDRFLLDAFVARFGADGALDETFGGDGLALVQRPSTATEFQALAVAGDGSILAGGREFGSIFNQNRWLLARFTSDGSLDPGFGTAGLTLFDPGAGDDVVLDLALTPAGIYATGATESVAFGLPVALFGLDGVLDERFGTGGLTGFPGLLTRGAVRVAGDTDGTILALGSSQVFVPSFNQDIALARYEALAADVVPPVLSLPTIVTVDATGPGGVTVDFSDAVSATDDVDGDVGVTCMPASESLFAIGVTSVTCTATDSSGNQASGTFVVRVRDAAAQVEELIALVDFYGLDKLGTSLHDKLVAVQRFLAAGKPRQAEENLESFLAQVEAQRGKVLTPGQATELGVAARRILDVIEA